MNWQNWGRYNRKTWDDNDKSTWTWNIDHIIPKSNFYYTSMGDENFKKCWALENLRPYPSKLNIIEQDRKIFEKLEYKDFEIIGYQSHPTIKADMCV